MLDLEPSASSAATYLAATLHALARDEHIGRRPRRLIEADHLSWNRFRGRLGPLDFAEIVLEDAAVTQPEPFAVGDILGSREALRTVPEPLVGRWLEELTRLPLDAPDRDYLDEQSKRLGFRARPAFSELPKLAPYHRVLELPGYGGRLAAHAVLTESILSIQDMFTIACASWQERVLAGIVAVCLNVRGFTRIRIDPTLEHARRIEGGFTHLLGLKPDKGGVFDAHTLEGFFPSATIVLV